jgi:amino acid transporter
VLTCLVIGILSAAEVYVGQLVWPAGQAFPEIDTAFVQVANRVGGPWFLATMNLTLMIACIGSGMASQLGAARLLYGMGRSNALPRSFFGAVDAKYRIPRNNVIFVGLVALGGAFLLDFSLGAEMLNFGALVAFIGVNVGCFLHFFVRSKSRTVWDFLAPLLGAAICFVLWLNLSRMAFIVGSIWVVAGTCYGAWRTKGFRTEILDFSID